MTALAYNPDGTRLAVGDADGEIRTWDASRFRPLGEPMRHQGAIRYLEYSPDGTRLATASYDKTARLWNPDTGAALGGVMNHRAYVWRIRFNRDGGKLLSASFDGTAQSGMAVPASRWVSRSTTATWFLTPSGAMILVSC